MIVVYTARNSSLRLYDRLRQLNIRAEVINTPRALSVGCGLSVKFSDRDYNRVKTLVCSLSQIGFAGIWREYSGVYNRIY